ncbi:hypothetical protein ACLKA7_004791 [Drosophila subpalustris]
MNKHRVCHCRAHSTLDFSTSLPGLLLGMFTSSGRRLEMCVAFGSSSCGQVDRVDRVGQKEFKVSATKFTNLKAYQVASHGSGSHSFSN